MARCGRRACKATRVSRMAKLAARLFVIDPTASQYSVVHNTSVGRRTEELLRVLGALQSGGLCPENWTAGALPLDPTAAIVVGASWRLSVRGETGKRLVRHRVQGPRSDARADRGRRSFSQASSPVRRRAQRGACRRGTTASNVCTVYSVDDSEGVPLIVMVRSGRIAERVARSGRSRQAAARSPRRRRRRWPSRTAESCMAI